MFTVFNSHLVIFLYYRPGCGLLNSNDLLHGARGTQMWTGAALLVSPDETSQCRVLLFYRYFPVTSRVVCKGLNGHAITASQLTLVQIARVSTGQLHEKVEFGINGFRFILLISGEIPCFARLHEFLAHTKISLQW